MIGFIRKAKESDEDFNKRMQEEMQSEIKLGQLRAELCQSQKKLYNMRKDILTNGTLEQKVEVLSAECIERMTKELHTKSLDYNLYLSGVYHA